MVRQVVLTKRAEKSLRKVPQSIFDEADLWRGLVQEHGIEVVQGIVAFRDHALTGKLKRSGIRSVSLSFGYRLFYRIVSEQIEFVLVEEVNHHDYKKVERLFGG